MKEWDVEKSFGHYTLTRKPMTLTEAYNNQSLIGYHATDNKFTAFDDAKGGYVGHYFALHNTTEGVLPTLLRNKKYTITAKLNVSNPAPINLFREEYKNASGGNPRRMAHNNLKSKGYDHVIRGDEIIVFDANNIEIIDINDNTSDAIMESIDELAELDSLVNDMSNEHEQKSNDELSKLALSLSEKDYLKELVTGEERYTYRKYLTKFSTEVPTDSLISEQAVEGDMVKQWHDIIEFKRPLIIVNGNKIIDGHHKYTAYKMRGIDTVPVIQINDLLKFYNDQVRN